MKRNFFAVLLILFFFAANSFAFTNTLSNPDSAYLFAYSVNEGRSGLTLAWSVDKQNWHAIGPEHTFLFSDFGTWGSQKRMFNPDLIKDQSGKWHCIWSLNDKVGQFAHAASDNLYEWKRQSYPEVVEAGNVQNLEVSSTKDGAYLITWETENNGKTSLFKTTTKDFKTYTSTKAATESERLNKREEVEINGQKQTGVVYSVQWDLIDGLIKNLEWNKFHQSERMEKMAEDGLRYNNLEPIEANISLEPTKAKSISDLLIGIFFEDINYAADGGLYAELIQNRDFEYDPSDVKGRDKTWDAKKAWSVDGDGISFSIDTESPIHANNKHFAVLDISKTGASLANEGYDGIAVKEGEKYNFSVFAKALEGTKQSLVVRLVDADGKVIGETKVKKVSADWKKYDATLTASKTAADAKLEVIPQATGKLALDMISLFPENTFKGRENGLRADLAQTIADIKPRFIRFPGGCVAHGDGLDNIYDWKNTIGPLEARVQQRNIWNYHQSVGLGYYEYFQFCEDIDAEPVPVLAAGVPCQNSSTGGYGQQGGIPMAEMDAYVQDVLDLIEWANGDKNSEWGKKRAAAGHPEPFNLKYIGIGNEDLITDIFEERFKIIYDAVIAKYPDIVVIGTVGPFSSGTDYVEGWELATELKVPMVDEHYYQTPGWFVNNQDYYDKYDRSKSKVYLGEYAAHLPGRPNNIETALTEALYLTSVERNADVVTMTSYAPLLAKENHTQWNPDLIYFNNTEVNPTVGYYVQKMYGNNSGNEYIPSNLTLSNKEKEVNKRVGISVVKDSKSGDLIIKLANLLPVAVSSTLDLSTYEIADSNAALTILTGDPTDKTATPEKSNITVSKNMKYQLPAYSFSIIRIKTQTL
ncbi:MAG: alpha-L-arabinofuranosidase [Thalassobius sp.]|nr:alpha-L-arabinofuranosidase [Thalassovita sp.]